MSERDTEEYRKENKLKEGWQQALDKDEDPCWEGYTMVGQKENGDPRCVPEEDVDNYDSDKSEKRRVYIDDPDEVPDDRMHTVQTGSRPDVLYYETEESNDSSRAGSVVEDLAGAVREYLEDDTDRLRDEIGLGEDPEREDMEELAEELMEEQAELVRAKMSKFLAKEFELDEGLTWTEQVEVVDVDMQDEEVTMQDTLNESQWTETIQEVEEKLEMLADREHEWLYQLVADDYANMQPQDVHETLHQAAGLETEQIEAEDTSERSIVVSEKGDVPEKYKDSMSEGAVPGTYEYTVSE